MAKRMAEQIASDVEVLGNIEPAYREILSPEAVDFLTLQAHEHI